MSKEAARTFEGFICPSCVVDFPSAGKLEDHWLKFHSQSVSDSGCVRAKAHEEATSAQHNSHVFKSRLFRIPETCGLCGRPIKKEGYLCQGCIYCCHQECLTMVKSVCPATKMSPVSTNNKTLEVNGGTLQPGNAKIHSGPSSPKTLVSHLRHKVSKGRVRHVDKEFDLDLTYITERIIAMSFPGTGLESSYRNSLRDVAKMLQSKHQDKYMVFNLSERRYDISKLNHQVLDFGWPDHLAPPFERLCSIIKSIDSWLKSDRQHVVVVHCKGGKGRTGVVISAYMQFSKVCSSPQAALDWFAMKRFYDDRLGGVTQPSQRRYVHYFSDYLKGGINLNADPIFLHHVIVHGIPNFDGKGGCKPFLRVYDGLKLIYTSGVFHVTSEMERICITIEGGLILRGDILIKCYHKNTLSSGRDIIFRCQFHTGALSDYGVVLDKSELDDACRDKRFPDGVKAEFVFSATGNAVSEIRDNQRLQSIIQHSLQPVENPDTVLFSPRDSVAEGWNPEQEEHGDQHKDRRTPQDTRGISDQGRSGINSVGRRPSCPVTSPVHVAGPLDGNPYAQVDKEFKSKLRSFSLDSGARSRGADPLTLVQNTPNSLDFRNACQSEREGARVALRNNFHFQYQDLTSPTNMASDNDYSRQINSIDRMLKELGDCTEMLDTTLQQSRMKRGRVGNVWQGEVPSPDAENKPSVSERVQFYNKQKWPMGTPARRAGSFDEGDMKFHQEAALARAKLGRTMSAGQVEMEQDLHRARFSSQRARSPAGMARQSPSPSAMSGGSTASAVLKAYKEKMSHTLPNGITSVTQVYSQRSGSPNQQKYGSSNQQRSASANQQRSDSPNQQRIVSPNQQRNGLPNQQRYDSTNQQKYGLPNQQHSASPNQLRNASPSQQRYDSTNQQRIGSTNQQRSGSPAGMTVAAQSRYQSQSPNSITTVAQIHYPRPRSPNSAAGWRTPSPVTQNGVLYNTAKVMVLSERCSSPDNVVCDAPKVYTDPPAPPLSPTLYATTQTLPKLYSATVAHPQTDGRREPGFFTHAHPATSGWREVKDYSTPTPVDLVNGKPPMDFADSDINNNTSDMQGSRDHSVENGFDEHPIQGTVASKIAFLSDIFSTEKPSRELHHQPCRGTVVPLPGLSNVSPSDVSKEIAEYNAKALAPGGLSPCSDMLYVSGAPPKRIIDRTPGKVLVGEPCTFVLDEFEQRVLARNKAVQIEGELSPSGSIDVSSIDAEVGTGGDADDMSALSDGHADSAFGGSSSVSTPVAGHSSNRFKPVLSSTASNEANSSTSSPRSSVDESSRSAQEAREDEASGYARLEDVRPAKLNAVTLQIQEGQLQQSPQETAYRPGSNVSSGTQTTLRGSHSGTPTIFDSRENVQPGVQTDLEAIDVILSEMTELSMEHSPPASPTLSSKAATFSSTGTPQSLRSTSSSEGFDKQRNKSQPYSDMGYGSTNSVSSDSSSGDNVFVESPSRIPGVKFVRDTSCYWYKPSISRDQAINLLKDQDPGTFVIRDSQSFPGAFGLAVKVAIPPAHVLKGDMSKVDLKTELVRHFLIESTKKGCRLKGCNEEPIFGSLSSFVYQHSITPLALPLTLTMPTEDLVLNGISQTQRENESNFAKGSAGTLIFLGCVGVEMLTGSTAVQKTVESLFKQELDSSKFTSVGFKVSPQGFTVTDNCRKMFFRRHFALSSIQYCGIDPLDKRWDLKSSSDFGPKSRAFGIVLRTTGEVHNECHLFAESNKEWTSNILVNVINRYMTHKPS